jgi:hypothetical protein
MKQHEVTVPQIGLIAGTRAMLGAGIALLLSEKLSDEQRRAIGWTLVAVGALTTIPLAFCNYWVTTNDRDVVFSCALMKS